MKKKNVIIFVIVIMTLAIFFYVKFTNSNVKKQEDIQNNINQEETPSDLIKNEEAVKPNSDADAKRFSLLAHEYYKKGDYADALKNINKAIAIEKNDRFLMSLYGIQLALKNYPEAQKAVLASLALNGNIPNNWTEYAYFERHYMNSNKEKISSIYEKGINSVDSKINIVIAYASYMSEMGEKNKAISLWQKAIELYPQNKTIYQAEIDRLSK